MESIVNLTPIIGSLAATAFTAVWFSKYGFGSVWLKSEGKPTKNILKSKDFFTVFIGHLLSSYVLSSFLQLGRNSGFLSGDMLDGVVLAAWGWLGFSIFASGFSAQVRKQDKEAIIIELGHHLIALIIIGAVLAY